MGMIIADQPKTPHGKAKAKSRALIVVDDMMDFVEPHKRRGYSIACFGNKGHYYDNGACVHVDELLIRTKSDWHRSRTWYLPFGDMRSEYTRAI